MNVLKTNPLGRLALTVAEMAERGLYVETEVRQRGIALAMVLSGGYPNRLLECTSRW